MQLTLRHALERLGVAVVERHDGHTVIREPEGNRFCVEPGPVGM